MLTKDGSSSMILGKVYENELLSADASKVRSVMSSENLGERFGINGEIA